MRKMSKTREIKMLIDRVDETLMVLALAIDDLVLIRDELKKLVKSLKESGETTLQKVMEALPQKVMGLVSLSQTEEYITINLKRRLNPEDFKLLASVAINMLKGEYVSTKNGGYFIIRKKSPATPAD
jgi:DNA relaxase NicK